MGGDLYWFQHLGRSDGSENWANGGVGLHVGTKLLAGPGVPIDWRSYISVFAAEDGVIYGVDDSGSLYWHQHLARSEGVELSRSWAEPMTGVHRVRVGSAVHWDHYVRPISASARYRPHLFAGDDGVIYGVDEAG